MDFIKVFVFFVDWRVLLAGRVVSFRDTIVMGMGKLVRVRFITVVVWMILDLKCACREGKHGEAGCEVCEHGDVDFITD